MKREKTKPIISTLLLTFFLLPSVGYAKHEHNEAWYQQQWCADHGGKAEVTLPDGTRADCMTETNAIEFDFGDKWAEAIGQSLYYAFQTNKKAGIVLILENAKDRRYWLRLNSVIQHYNLPITTWSVGNGAY